MQEVQSRQSYDSEGDHIFFLTAFSHDSLMNMFSTNFAMMQNFNYKLSDLEEMMPWEREIYLQLLMEHLKEERERMRESQNHSG